MSTSKIITDNLEPLKRQPTESLQKEVTFDVIPHIILTKQKTESDAFKLLSKQVVAEKNLTPTDFFEYENRLRSIVHEIMKPTHEKLKLT